jgi:endonuclease YncB( thermonuclease family)
VTRAGRRLAVLLTLLTLASGAVGEASGGEIVPRADRDVTPSGATRLPESDQPLVREKVPPPPPEPARWRRFFLPATRDAATFQADKLTIRVSGVTPAGIDQVCRGSEGDWPCGKTALLSFRLFLRGRAVECYFPRPEGIAEVVAPCRVGKTDLGLWLLSQGWAKPDGNATDAYRLASHAAACDGRGLWRGEAKPADC